MHPLLAFVGLILVALVLIDAFEVMVLPRRVTRTLRPVRLYYRLAWGLWSGLARRLPRGKRRENFLSIFGPLSLLTLFALWAPRRSPGLSHDTSSTTSPSGPRCFR